MHLISSACFYCVGPARDRLRLRGQVCPSLRRSSLGVSPGSDSFPHGGGSLESRPQHGSITPAATARRGWRGQPPHTAIYPKLLSLHSCNFYYCLQFFLCIFLGSNDCNIRLRLLSTVRRGSAAARGHVRETKQCKLAGSRRNPRYSHCQ